MFKAMNGSTIGVTLPFPELAKVAAQHGFQGMYLKPEQLIATALNETKDSLSRYELKPATFPLPVEYKASETEYRASLQELPAIAQAASELGCTRCSIWIIPWSDQLTFADNFALHRDRLGASAEILGDHGIRLALEFIGPETIRKGKKFEFIHTLHGMLELCDAIGTGNVGLLLDCWHWYTAGHGPQDLDVITNDNVIDVHVNDAPANVPLSEQEDLVRELPAATGVIDVGTFMQKLVAIGYDGPVMVEPFDQNLNTMDDYEAVSVVAQSLNKVWPADGRECQ